MIPRKWDRLTLTHETPERSEGLAIRQLERAVASVPLSIRKLGSQKFGLGSVSEGLLGGGDDVEVEEEQRDGWKQVMKGKPVRGKLTRPWILLLLR